MEFFFLFHQPSTEMPVYLPAYLPAYRKHETDAGFTHPVGFYFRHASTCMNRSLPASFFLLRILEEISPCLRPPLTPPCVMMRMQKMQPRVSYRPLGRHCKFSDFLPPFFFFPPTIWSTPPYQCVAWLYLKSTCYIVRDTHERSSRGCLTRGCPPLGSMSVRC